MIEKYVLSDRYGMQWQIKIDKTILEEFMLHNLRC